MNIICFRNNDVLLTKSRQLPQTDDPVFESFSNENSLMTPFGLVTSDEQISQKIQEHTDAEFCELRATRLEIEPTLFSQICRYKQHLHWHKNSLFCSHCGAPTTQTGHVEKSCTKCNNKIYPPLAPAIIVLVHKDEEALLVRALNFRGNHYGLVAGFVEPGESLEEAVVRELDEEVGLKVSNIRYFGSQPWPFPCGIMIGFQADYESGEIRLQEDELADAQWFSKKNLPQLPDGMSIARQLINNWLGE